MPPKRSLGDADPGARSGPAKGGKQSKKTAEPEENANAGDSSGWEDVDSNDDSDELPPYEYYCRPRPFFDFERENDEKDEDEQLDEDDLIDQYNGSLGPEKNIAKMPAAKHPEHTWVSMWKAWKKFCELKRHASYTDPDAFGMYIYNDFHGYGLQELVQNTLLAFDKEFNKKTRDDDRLNEMWSISSGMVHWLLEEELGAWFMMDDGDLFIETMGLIGLSFVAMLNELDRADLLKADSRIKDLGLVMASYIRWSDSWKEFAPGEDEDEMDWPEGVVAYAKKAGIDLENVGVYGVKDRLTEIGTVEPLEGDAKADRWGWKKKFTAFKKSNGITVGQRYNILLMSRRERAAHAFDKKDPLKHIPEKELKKGNLMMVLE